MENCDTLLDEKNMRDLEELEATGWLVQHQLPHQMQQSTHSSKPTTAARSYEEEEAAYKLAMRRRKLLAISSRTSSSAAASISRDGDGPTSKIDVSPNVFPSRLPPMGSNIVGDGVVLLPKADIEEALILSKMTSSNATMPRPGVLLRTESFESRSSQSSSLSSVEGTDVASTTSVLHDILCRSPNKSSSSGRAEFARWAKLRLGHGDDGRAQQQQIASKVEKASGSVLSPPTPLVAAVNLATKGLLS